jgi:hypothetical protein
LLAEGKENGALVGAVCPDEVQEFIDDALDSRG